MQAVLDSGVRWTAASIVPIIELIRVQHLFPKVRSQVLKAVYLLVKEGDRICSLLSQAGFVKTLALQVSARGVAPIDADDIHYLRILTSICEVDSSKYEDIVVIGALPRILALFRKNLVDHSTLLPTESEVQRRCFRFLEKVAAKPALRHPSFESGALLLLLDILEMPHSRCKLQAVQILAVLMLDSNNQTTWHQTLPTATARLANHLQPEGPLVRIKVLEVMLALAPHRQNVADMVTIPSLMDVVVAVMERACKMEDRDMGFAILATCSKFLFAFASHDFGKQHVLVWNVVAQIDPNMRKVKSLFVGLRANEEIWKPYDKFISAAAQ